MNPDLRQVVERVKSDGLGTIYCSHFKNVPGFPGCCDSCHDDENEGFEMIPYEQIECTEIELHVCCRVALWLDELL